MAQMDNQVPQNVDFLAQPSLGPELASGKWKVRVIDADERITEEFISGKQVWSMFNRRVMLDFNRMGQTIKDSGGLFGTWLGSLSNDLHLLPIDYTDWRLVPAYRKDMAWNVIQSKFWFDDPNKRKKYVLSCLGSRCKDMKQRLWKNQRRNTIKESIRARPPLIPEDQWRHFVHIQFTEKTKRMRHRNISNRSKLKLPHALGKKSLARKADDMLEDMGREPSRGELFIASRTRSDGTYVSEEARICVEKLREVMNQDTEKKDYKDDFEEIFGPEHSGRVRCVGRGPTPSKYFQSLKMESSMKAEMRSVKSEIGGLKSQMGDLKDKVDIVADALQTLITNNQIQASTKQNSNLPQIISLLSQASTMGGSMNLPQIISLLSKMQEEEDKQKTMKKVKRMKKEDKA